MYVNLLLGVSEGDVHIANLGDHCCASWRAVLSTRRTLCSPQGAGTCLSDITDINIAQQ